MFCLFYRIYGHFVFRSPQPPPWGRTTGAVRPEDYPHREGCVRDKWEAQKPTTALASGFGYLLPPKGTKPPRHTPRLRLLCRPKSGKEHQSQTAISTFCGKKVQNTRDIVAAFSVLLMATDARSTSRDRLRAMPCQKEENERSEVKSTKTIRMSLSREQPPARVERAQQEQDYAASRSGHAGCRLFFFRSKR